MNYTTQMDAARKGIFTPELMTVAEKENMPAEKLQKLVAEGKVAICANKAHKCLDPEGIGSMLRTKINVNLGVSRDCKDYDVEMQKVMHAVEMGAESIMDLSSHGNTQPFRQKLTAECPAIIGTVPVYDSVIHYQRDLATLTAKDFIDVIRLHAEDGVDFVTLHCGITRKTIDQIKKHKRKTNIVRRQPCIRMDEHDRGRESFLRILRRDPRYLRKARCHYISRRCMPSGMSGRRH